MHQKGDLRGPETVPGITFRAGRRFSNHKSGMVGEQVKSIPSVEMAAEALGTGANPDRGTAGQHAGRTRASSHYKLPQDRPGSSTVTYPQKATAVLASEGEKLYIGNARRDTHQKNQRARDLRRTRDRGDVRGTAGRHTGFTCENDGSK